jgi:site-specific DNA-methyltransferase (adenine-specific)
MTELTTEADAVRVFHGDSRDVLKGFPDNHFDSVVCDPPYALVSIVKRFGGPNAAPAQVGASGAYARASSGFMNQTWDTGETAFAVTFWAEVMRVLKPGGHVIAASGTRTYHRLAVAIEDAGFEVRDMILWLYGAGFPKSHDVAKGIDKAAGVMKARGAGFNVAGQNVGLNQNRELRSDHPDYVEPQPITDAAIQWKGWGTALKPACEPWILARKPFDKGMTVAANVLQHGTGALNIDASRIGTEGGTAKAEPVKDSKTVNAFGNGLNGGGVRALDAGRWPANVIHDGSEEVTGAFPETGASSGAPRNNTTSLGSSSGGIYGAGAAFVGAGHEDNGGSAARFFYSAKADAEDRLGSKHPTVKPVDLMAYLVRLVTPPGGLTLDPFAGSGTTGLGAMREGMRCVLIEREEAYVGDIMRKLAWARGEGRLTSLEQARLDTPEKHAKAAGADLPLFGDA